MEKRPMFRWHVNHDIDLLKEVAVLRHKNPVDWNLIAANLQQAWGDALSTPIKGRSCKEHFDVLLAHHKAGNATALKKSGTEEEYGELQLLLDDILVFIDDLQKEKSSNKKKKQDEIDREMAKKLRNSAMATLKQKSSPSSDSDEETDDTSPKVKKAKTGTKRSKRPDVMSYLTEKREADSAFREKELEYKRDALDAETKLKEDALSLEQKKTELQEKQLNLQTELLKALVASSMKG